MHRALLLSPPHALLSNNHLLVPAACNNLCIMQKNGTSITCLHLGWTKASSSHNSCGLSKNLPNDQKLHHSARAVAHGVTVDVGECR